MKRILPQKCHFIGIGGIGMSGLARLLLKEKIAVSGSDCRESDLTLALANEGARIATSHSADNIPSDAAVIVSSSIGADNIELQEAKKKGCPLWHRSDLLQHLMATKKTLAVAGTHGKTTTSALMTHMLKEAALDPTFMVGGIVANLGVNSAKGEGDYFVAEADESDGTFVKYSPFGAIVTNLGSDHLEHYGSDSALIDSFRRFIQGVQSKDHLVWCGDDMRLRALDPPGRSYGFEGADILISNYKQNGWSITFDVTFDRITYPDIFLPCVGRHSALNGAAVFALGVILGVDEGAIRRAFQTFEGVRRRLEKKGEVSGVLFLDDYAHHPTEIAATLSGIRSAVGKRRVIALFQPHRYSRIAHCMDGLASSFDEAYRVYVTDIYSAGEAPIEGVSQESLLKTIPRSAPFDEACFVDQLRPHDVVVTLGAGDITHFGQRAIARLKQNPPKKLRVGLVQGGRSEEHEISLISAAHVASSLSPDLYEVKRLTIHKEGGWEPPDWLPLLESCDVVFPVLHGPCGEDGTIQGFFEMMGFPYVGCGHRASAIAMDKALTKELALLNGVRTLPFVKVKKGQWGRCLKNRVLEELAFPVFVKGVHLGSSIGVVKVLRRSELDDAVRQVFDHDDALIVEQGIIGREMEFAALGDRIFPPGEVLARGEFYDTEKKYGAGGFPTTADPDLPEELVKMGQDLALKAFQAIGGEGMARIDFLLDASGRFWLNEINPIPGFTPISLYPRICERHGYPPARLVDELIVHALSRSRERARHG